MDLGTNLKHLRKEKGLTQEDLAECLNVTPQTVSKWENDLSAPDIACLPVLAEFYGITVDALLRGDVNRREEMKALAARIHALADSGQTGEAYDTLKASLKNWALSASMNHLMSWTAYSLAKEKAGAEKQALLEEAILYADRTIRLDGGESSRTAQAKMTKCYCMEELGRAAEAMKIAQSLPSVFSSRERVLARISQGAEKEQYTRTALDYLDELRKELEGERK